VARAAWWKNSLVGSQTVTYVALCAGLVCACGGPEGNPLAPEPDVSTQSPDLAATPATGSASNRTKDVASTPVRGDRSEVSDVGRLSTGRQPPPAGSTTPQNPPKSDGLLLSFEFSVASGAGFDAGDPRAQDPVLSTWHAVLGKDGKKASPTHESMRRFFMHHLFPYLEGQDAPRRLESALADTLDTGDSIAFTPLADASHKNAATEAELGKLAAKFGATVQPSPFSSAAALKDATADTFEDLARAFENQARTRSLHFAFETTEKGKDMGSSVLASLMHLAPLGLPMGEIVPLVHKEKTTQTWLAFLRDDMLHAIVQVPLVSHKKFAEGDKHGEVGNGEEGGNGEIGGCTRVTLSFPPELVLQEVTTSLLIAGTSTSRLEGATGDAVAPARLVPFSELTDCLPEGALLLVQGVLR